TSPHQARPQLRSSGRSRESDGNFLGSWESDRIRSDLGHSPTRLDLQFDDVSSVGEEASWRERLRYDLDISRAGLRDRVPIGEAEERAMTKAAVRVGAVAAGPSGRTIWGGVRAYFAEAGVAIVPGLFSSYEGQTAALFQRALDTGWDGAGACVRWPA